MSALKQTCNNNGFLIKSGILYKRGDVLGQEIYKLVLPEGLAHQVLNATHMKHETHASAHQLSSIFGSTFYSKHLKEIAKKVANACILC